MPNLLLSMSIGVGSIILSHAMFANPDSGQVIQFLNQTIDWYRQVVPLQQTATEPDDILIVTDEGRMAEQVVRLAFDFARAEAELTKQENPDSGRDQGGVSPQHAAFLQLEEKIDNQAKDTQAELDALRQKVEGASGKKRQQVQAQIAEMQSELDLTKARREAMHDMAQFMGGSSTTALGASGLQGQIDALADAVPAVSAPANSNQAALAPKEPPIALAAGNKPASSGIWDLTADLFALSQQIHRVDATMQQTSSLTRMSKQLRSPLVSRLRELSNQGDELATQAHSANPSGLEQEKQQLDALAAQFRQISAASLPLSEQGIVLALYEKSLGNWERNLQSRRVEKLKGLLIRLTFLAVIIGIVMAAARLWRIAVYRYVHDPRRRYQFLLLRKFVLWFLIAVIVAFAFASRLGSVVTFAGLITAGVAVALQSVILSVVGYFFLIGKYGIRVGDRVQIGGVTGEVVNVGLVRLHLMELGGGADSVFTGRVVAFSNSIVFQPTAGLFKQIPGTNFLWHEITLALSPDTDYATVKERLLAVVEGVLGDYREDMEGQYRAVQTTLISTAANGFRPKAQVRFTPSAIEVVIRFPVDRQQASEIDEHVTRELLRNLDHEPKLKLVNSVSPSIVVRTDLAA